VLAQVFELVFAIHPRALQLVGKKRIHSKLEAGFFSFRFQVEEVGNQIV
jgi:hypothetical protein